MEDFFEHKEKLEKDMRNHPDGERRIDAGLQYAKVCEEGDGAELISLAGDQGVPAEVREAAKKAVDRVGEEHIDYLFTTVGFPESVLEISRNHNLSEEFRTDAGMTVIRHMYLGGMPWHKKPAFFLDMATDCLLPETVRQKAGEMVLDYFTRLEKKGKIPDYKQGIIYDFAVKLITNPVLPAEFRKKTADMFSGKLQKMVEHFSNGNAYYHLLAMSRCENLPAEIRKAAEAELGSAAPGMISDLESKGNLMGLSFFAVYPEVPEKTRKKAREKAERMFGDVVKTNGFIVDSDMLSKYSETVKRKKPAKIKKSKGKRKARG